MSAFDLIHRPSHFSTLITPKSFTMSDDLDKNINDAIAAAFPDAKGETLENYKRAGREIARQGTAKNLPVVGITPAAMDKIEEAVNSAKSAGSSSNALTVPGSGSSAAQQGSGASLPVLGGSANLPSLGGSSGVNIERVVQPRTGAQIVARAAMPKKALDVGGMLANFRDSAGRRLALLKDSYDRIAREMMTAQEIDSIGPFTGTFQKNSKLLIIADATASVHEGSSGGWDGANALHLQLAALMHSEIGYPTRGIGLTGSEVVVSGEYKKGALELLQWLKRLAPTEGPSRYEEAFRMALQDAKQAKHEGKELIIFVACDEMESLEVWGNLADYVPESQRPVDSLRNINEIMKQMKEEGNVKIMFFQTPEPAEANNSTAFDATRLMIASALGQNVEGGFFELGQPVVDTMLALQQAESGDSPEGRAARARLTSNSKHKQLQLTKG
jgi:hypothetical protein